jgi:hypothetical protein
VEASHIAGKWATKLPTPLERRFERIRSDRPSSSLGQWMNDNLVTRSTAVADEQGMAEVAISAVWFAGCQAHRFDTIRTNRRADGCGGIRLTNLWHHTELPKDLVVDIIRQEKPGSKPQFRFEIQNFARSL